VRGATLRTLVALAKQYKGLWLVVLITAAATVGFIYLRMVFMSVEPRNGSYDELDLPLASLLNNESTYEKGGLVASIPRVWRKKDRLLFEYVLASAPCMNWAFNGIEPLHCQFWMDDGDTFVDAVGVFLVMDTTFVERNRDSFRTTFEVAVPDGAKYMTVAFGKSDLVTRKIRIPHEEASRLALPSASQHGDREAVVTTARSYGTAVVAGRNGGRWRERPEPCAVAGPDHRGALQRTA
jgi:hypothetical protein